MTRQTSTQARRVASIHLRNRDARLRRRASWTNTAVPAAHSVVAEGSGMSVGRRMSAEYFASTGEPIESLHAIDAEATPNE